MTAFDPKKTWDLISSLPGFEEQTTPATRAVLKEIVDATPDALGDLLGRPATCVNAVEAKLRITRRLIEGNFVERARAGVPDAEQDFPLDFMKQTMGISAERMAEIVADLPAWLAKRGITERDAMFSEFDDLSPETWAAWESGALTIGGLIEMDPMPFYSGT